MGAPLVRIECVYGQLSAPPAETALVVTDVIRATTTAITAASLGWECFPVATLDEARALASGMTRPLLAGEIRGIQPKGFEAQNSPVAVSEATDRERPLILLSTGGTRLLVEAAAASPEDVHVTCLRNYASEARALIAEGRDVLLLAPATRDDFREEDQLCLAWIAALLIDAGFAGGDETVELAERWRSATVERIQEGRSVAYLRRSGQLHDWDFIRTHVDDLELTYRLVDGRIRTPR